MQEKTILNHEVNAIPVFIGRRTPNSRELKGASKLYSSAFGSLPVNFIHYSDESDQVEKVLISVEEYVASCVSSYNCPYAVFPVVTTFVGKNKKLLLDLFDRIRAIRKDIFVYPIVWDSYPDCELIDSGEASFINIDTTSSAPGVRRVCEFIYRIMGYDRIDDIFPYYDQETIRKIAKHIIHENFNREGEKVKFDSIPKYKIFDGKLYFPDLYVLTTCPYCEHENEVVRMELDKKGGAKVYCPKEGCGKYSYFPNLAIKFGAWTEYDNYRK